MSKEERAHKRDLGIESYEFIPWGSYRFEYIFIKLRERLIFEALLGARLDKQKGWVIKKLNMKCDRVIFVQMEYCNCLFREEFFNPRPNSGSNPLESSIGWRIYRQSRGGGFSRAGALYGGVRIRLNHANHSVPARVYLGLRAT